MAARLPLPLQMPDPSVVVMTGCGVGVGVGLRQLAGDEPGDEFAVGEGDDLCLDAGFLQCSGCSWRRPTSAPALCARSFVAAFFAAGLRQWIDAAAFRTQPYRCRAFVDAGQ